MKEYGDNIIQLEIEKNRLRELLEQKCELINKYFPGCKSIDLLKDVNSYIPGPKNQKRTPMDDFMIELEEKNIISDIDQTTKKINQLEERINFMRSLLNKIKGYEKKIYICMLNGNNITKSVRIVSEESGLSERTIWRYAKKLRNIMNKYGLKEDKIEIIL